MKTRVALSVPIVKSARVAQVEGIFDLPPSQRSETILDIDLPIEERDWHIGLIVGPSGSGKSTVARELFAESIVQPWRWPQDKSVIDSFPTTMPIKEVTELLSSVGFSTPPAWLRPFRALSNGEQFRVMIAHAIAQEQPLTIIDEFTSVVDRTVAKMCSAAVARTIRRRKQKLIAISCHYDIVGWLDPDWTFEPHVNRFDWRALQGRPKIPLRIVRVDQSAWRLFRHTHYLDTELARASVCFMAYVEERPAAFCAVLPFPHASRPGWRFHRLVCLPDFQGVGIGVHFSDYVASLFKATGKPVFRTLAHPAVIRHCAKSPVWNMIRTPSKTSVQGRTSSTTMNSRKTAATDRLTAGFEYVGPPNKHDALRFGLQA